MVICAHCGKGKGTGDEEMTKSDALIAHALFGVIMQRLAEQVNAASIFGKQAKTIAHPCLGEDVVGLGGIAFDLLA